VKEAPEYVTAREALALLEVSEGKLTAMLKSGELSWRPNPRNKRAKLIKRADIEAWLANAPLPPKREVREQKARDAVASETLAPWAEIVPEVPYPMTAEDLALLPDDSWQYELVSGRLVRVAPPGGEHGDIALELGAALRIYVKAHRLGRVLAAGTGFLLPLPGKSQQTELAPDVSFVQTRRLPPRQSEAYRAVWPLAPDLVAEVASPTQHQPEMAAKARQWLAGGVRLVWVVWPKEREVDLWLPVHENPVQTLRLESTLNGRDVVPGFSYPLKELFA
jgi:Uma2 family endonuclease